MIFAPRLIIPCVPPSFFLASPVSFFSDLPQPSSLFIVVRLIRHASPSYIVTSWLYNVRIFITPFPLRNWQGYEGIEPQSSYLFRPVRCAPYTIALYRLFISYFIIHRRKCFYSFMSQNTKQFFISISFFDINTCCCF